MDCTLYRVIFLPASKREFLLVGVKIDWFPQRNWFCPIAPCYRVLEGLFIVSSPKIANSGQKNFDNRFRDIIAIWITFSFCKLIFFVQKFKNFENFVSVKNWGKPVPFNPNTQKLSFRNQ